MIKHRKAKGNYLENKVADLFKKKFKLHQDDVHRAQSSGSFSSEYGDVYFRNYHIIAECKNQNVVNFKSLYPVLNKTILKFYEQLNEEVNKLISKYPEIKNYLSFLVVSDSSKRFGPFVIKKIKDLNKEYSELIDLLVDKTSYIVTHDVDNNKYIIVQLDDFVEHIDIEKFKR